MAFSMPLSKNINPVLSWKNDGSHALFMWPTNIFFIKNNFKTEFHDTIHIFKIYFVTVFLVFSNKRYPNWPYVKLICCEHFENWFKLYAKSWFKFKYCT